MWALWCCGLPLALGVAVFVGGWALEQLWLFWLAPVAGAVLGAVAWRTVQTEP